MGEIVVKVVGEAASGSVSLPDDVPLAALIGDLSRHYAPDAWADPLLDAGGGALDLDTPLSASGVLDGAELRISRRTAPLAARSEDEAVPELGVTVVGSNGARRPIRVPAGVPMRVVAAQLGEALGIDQVADVRLADGTLVPPAKSLEALGVRTGATLSVRAVGDPAEAAVPPTGKRRRLGRLGWVAVCLTVVAAATGGVLVGRSTAAAESGAARSLRSAGAAWVAAAPYRGPAWPGVGRSLGRSGKLMATLEPAGAWRVGTESGRAWIVSAPGRTPWGLEAVAFQGRLGYDPTPAGLPFVTGQAPPISGRVLAHGPAPAAIGDWVAKVWGRSGTLTPVVGMGALGAPRVLAAYRPTAGGLVWRVQVTLSSGAPGAPPGIARAALAAEETKVSADQRGLHSAQHAVGAAQAALAAAAKAKPANPAAISAAQAALTTAQHHAQAAQVSLSHDNAALGSARAAETRLIPLRAVGTYDLWVRGGRLVGWAPAGYQGGTQ